MEGKRRSSGEGECTRPKPDRALGKARHHPSTPASPPPTPSTMANALYNLYRLAGPAAAGALLFNASIYDVRGGTRAVIFDRLAGVKEQVMNEGTHFLVPWLQRAIIYDVRTKPRNISTTTGSKDLQMVSLTLRVLHRPEVPRLPQIYQVSNHHSPTRPLLFFSNTVLIVIRYRLR